MVASTQQTARRGPSRRRMGVSRWTLACAAAEVVGLGLAAAWWILADRVSPEPTLLTERIGMVVAKSFSGVGEGIVLGLVQAVLLRRVYERLGVPQFVLMTVLVAVFGWAAGSAISVFGSAGDGTSISEPPLWWIVIFAAAFGVIAGSMFGAAQWVVLRRAASPASWWIVANAAGWAIALPLVYVAASFNPSSHPLLIFAVVTLAGLLAGACVGIATGLASLRMKPVG